MSHVPVIHSGSTKTLTRMKLLLKMSEVTFTLLDTGLRLNCGMLFITGNEILILVLKATFSVL